MVQGKWAQMPSPTSNHKTAPNLAFPEHQAPVDLLWEGGTIPQVIIPWVSAHTWRLCVPMNSAVGK